MRETQTIDGWRKIESKLENHRFHGNPTFKDMSRALAGIGESILRLLVLGWGGWEGRVPRGKYPKKYIKPKLRVAEND